MFNKKDKIIRLGNTLSSFSSTKSLKHTCHDDLNDLHENFYVRKILLTLFIANLIVFLLIILFLWEFSAYFKQLFNSSYSIEMISFTLFVLYYLIIIHKPILRRNSILNKFSFLIYLIAIAYLSSLLIICDKTKYSFIIKFISINLFVCLAFILYSFKIKIQLNSSLLLEILFLIVFICFLVAIYLLIYLVTLNEQPSIYFKERILRVLMLNKSSFLSSLVFNIYVLIDIKFMLSKNYNYCCLLNEHNDYLFKCFNLLSTDILLVTCMFFNYLIKFVK